MVTAGEQFIKTGDLRQLRSGSLWPIMGVLAPDFVEEIELGCYMRRLLATHRWSVVRVVPHADVHYLPSTHVFDVYAQPAEPDARALA